MAAQLPSHARVVIIGGGIIGCSIAYHLTKLGWTDVLVLERGELTCGTTWHAAGLVMQLRSNFTMTQLSRYGAELYEKLEAETGQATGFKRNGSLAIARTEGRFTEVKRMASLGHWFGVDVDVVSPAAARDIYPLLDPSRIVGGIFIPGDAQTNPADTTMALAKGATQGGARIFNRTSVTGFKLKNGAVAGVLTDKGDIGCEIAVNCGGIWARQIGRLAGVNVPLYAAEHMYVVTTAMAEVKPDLPVLRDADGYVYVKEDAGKLLVGCFEPVAKPLPLEQLPAGFAFGELPADWEHFELPMTRALEMIPLLERAEIRHFLNGPESFTPDNKFIMGEAPEVRNYFVAAGFNSQGILAGAGAGKAMAEWIVAGKPTMDLSEIDIARFHPFQVNERYLQERTSESLGLLYAMHWPHRQVETARPVRMTPLHDRLAARGACFGETAGWERANWYAPAGMKPQYQYAYGRQNWFAPVGAEHRAVRAGVGIFDLSSFAKYLVQGPDAEKALQWICANDVAVASGKVVYTAMLNARAGIEADITVTRLAEDRYMVVTAAASQTRDYHWLRRNMPADARVYVTDVTAGFGVLSIMGPRSRDLLRRLTGDDLSTAAFPFATAREIDVGYARALALRVSYVGELGWELYLSSEFVPAVFDRLMAEGEDLGVKLAGYHALDSLRCEKGFRHWGHDITPDDTPLEARLTFAVAVDKPGGFLGRDGLLRRKQEGLRRTLVHLTLDDPEALFFHDEPIYRNGEKAGRITSGAFGYTLGRAVGLGYIHHPPGAGSAFIADGRYEIEIAMERTPATCSLAAFYDPAHERMRA